MPWDLHVNGQLALADVQGPKVLLDMNDEECVLFAPERPDDPVTNARITETVDDFENALLDILQTKSGDIAWAAVRTFARAARARALGDWEQAYARRLELSLRLTLGVRFKQPVEDVELIALEMVELPCHRRMHQLREIVTVAGYFRDCSRPDAAWRPLLKAIALVESEIPEHPDWIENREAFRSVVAWLWNAMDDRTRRRLNPYVPPPPAEPPIDSDS